MMNSTGLKVQRRSNPNALRGQGLANRNRGGAVVLAVTARVTLPESATSSAAFHCDVDLEFAGQKAAYHDVPFQAAKTGNEIRSGTIPATLADFKI